MRLGGHRPPSVSFCSLSCYKAARVPASSGKCFIAVPAHAWSNEDGATDKTGYPEVSREFLSLHVHGLTGRFGPTEQGCLCFITSGFSSLRLQLYSWALFPPGVVTKRGGVCSPVAGGGMMSGPGVASVAGAGGARAGAGAATTAEWGAFEDNMQVREGRSVP